MNKNTTRSKKKTSKKQADQYDNGDYNYLHYWDGRDYEHASEEMAIRRFLRGSHYKRAIDIGGGYGRLCVLLRDYADEVTLAEPSKKQLAIAKTYLRDYPEILQKQMQADDLQCKTNSVDLITMIRVMHHLPDPTKEFDEIARALRKDGFLILEVANNAHMLNRIRYALRGQSIPAKPVDIRSEENQREDEVAFVNHNPKTVIKQLAHAGLKVEKTLSVSNLRNPTVKRVVPLWILRTIERPLQPLLSQLFFGPSVFFLVRRVK